MFSLNELKRISEKQNVIFYKPFCPFCKAAEDLMKKLKEIGIINEYKVYILDKDFDNETLKNLVLEYKWKPERHQEYPTKPQIFMNISGKAEYIGGNKEFYNSKWNLGENNSKQIKIKNLSYNTPNLKNPMRF